MSQTRRSKNIYDPFRENRPQDVINTLFLVFVFTFYSVYMHDKYFDITLTRATTFTDGVIAYLALMISAFFVEYCMLTYYLPGYSLKDSFHRDCRVIALPELWVLLFLLANLLAFFMAPVKTAAWTGSLGRRFGLAMILALSLMFLVLAYQTVVSSLVLVVLAATAAFAACIAFLQHFGMDPFALREDVIGSQKTMFISTFGNINTYSSYIAIVLSVFGAALIFDRIPWHRILSACMVLILGAAIIPGKSDNVYLGLLAAYLLLFYLAVLKKRMAEYFQTVFVMSVGLSVMAYFSQMYNGSQGHINGIAEGVENPAVMSIFSLIFLIINGLILFIRYRFPEPWQKFQGRKFLLFFTVFLVAAVIVVCIAGYQAGISLFHFNDEWGTYRGYIWRRGFDLFKMAPLKNKLFGYGNETVGALMRENFPNEMIRITNKRYDNCHNELLQYLVTTGIFGMVSYLGIYISSAVYIIRRAASDPVPIACLAAATAYAAQGLVNLNQPITTPFYFVFLAMGIGYIRYRDQGYGKFHTEEKS